MIPLSQFIGHTSLVINVASEWGKTKLTYGQIGKLLERYSHLRKQDNTDGHDQLVILAFPSNDFHQESGSNQEIKQKIKTLLGSELFDNPNFVLFEKSSLKDNPVFQLLHRHFPDKFVRQNFFKYLINYEGIPTSIHSKKESLLDVEDEIVVLLER